MFGNAIPRYLAAAALTVVPVFGAVPHASSNDALIDAIREQNHTLAASLIAGHANVNAVQPDGATALAWAAYLDEADIVDLLMKAGAKPNTTDEYGETPLTLAAATGDTVVMEKLIAAGADAKAARWNGETALMIAARTGNLAGVKLLLAHGAKIDAAETRKGQNALMWASAEGHGNVVDFLIQSGADVKAVSKGGFTPLVFAAQKGDEHSVRSLLDAGLSSDYVLPDGTSILHLAASGGKPEIVKALLDHNVSVNVADKSGFTALDIAAQSGELAIVKQLLAKNADPNLVTNEIKPLTGRAAFRAPAGQQTALLLAARANHPDVMHALVEAGANPKAKAQDGSTLLMAAAGSGHLAPVEYAYELDPDITAVNVRKTTVMHAAVTVTLQNGTQADVCEVVKFLASKGAPLDELDSAGRTPIQIADILPIDQAVLLLTKLITDSGQTPKKPSKR